MKYTNMPFPKAKAKEPSLDTKDDKNRKGRVEKTYIELMEQPVAFTNAIEKLEKEQETLISQLKKKNRITNIILIGCGDSWFVGNGINFVLEELMQCACTSMQAFEFLHYPTRNITDHTLVIGQSSGGSTSAVLDSLQFAKERGAYTIGLTNTNNAKIEEIADWTFVIPVLRKGWPTQATTSAMGCIVKLGCTISKRFDLNGSFAENIENELSRIPALMQEAIEENQEKIKSFAMQQAHLTYVQATGSGPSFAVAQIAAAKLKELCPVHACAYPIEEFHHYRSLKKNDLLILVSPQKRAKQREIDTAIVGAYDGGVIVVIGDSLHPEMEKVTDLFCKVPEVSEYLTALVSSIPTHLFSYYLADAKFKLGIGYQGE